MAQQQAVSVCKRKRKPTTTKPVRIRWGYLDEIRQFCEITGKNESDVVDYLLEEGIACFLRPKLERYFQQKIEIAHKRGDKEGAEHFSESLSSHRSIDLLFNYQDECSDAEGEIIFSNLSLEEKMSKLKILRGFAGDTPPAGNA